jgi:cytochrome c
VSAGGRRPGTVLAVPAMLVAAAIVTACAGTPSRTAPPQVPHGNPRLGAMEITRYDCGACHVIPGIEGATGMVGPPLVHWSQRGFIAGELENNGPNLIRWIMDPRGVEPNTDMPGLGVSQSEARDMAAYLFSIR